MGVARLWLVPCGLLSITGLLRAQAPPLGTEFPVNTYTTGPQHNVAAASRGDGTFMIVWSDGYPLSRGIEGEDGSTSGIFGQRFGSEGQKVGTDFLINTFTTGSQANPAVAMNAAGDAVVVWKSPQDDPSAFFGSGVYGQRLDAAGAKVGTEFLVNTYTTSAQSQPAVGISAGGGFVVVWSSNGQDGSGSGIYGQRFDAAGTKAGAEFRVNTFTTDSQFSPSVAMDSAGDFVVVWESSGQDGDDSGVFGQAFDFSGARKGPEFQVNTYTTSGQRSPSVSMDRVGNFAVAFQSDGPDLDGFGIWARRYNSSAEPLLGPEFQVNSYVTGAQTVPSVSMDRRGNFSVVWESAFQDGAKGGIFGQRFDRNGFLVGSEFAINTFTADAQESPKAFDDGAGFAAAWSSETEDGDGPGVYARRQKLHPRGLAVDTQGIGITDLNGVLEPGEAAVVVPAWSNDGETFVALDASVPSLDGPFGPTYTLLDSAATYGSMAPNTLATCNDGNSNPCYAVQISGARPATHWDASFQENLSAGGAHRWKLHLGDSFSDVPRSQPFYRKIETLLHNGITSGCTTTQYCPDGSVPREQMAIFVAKGIAGTGDFVPKTGLVGGQPYNCNPGGVSRFSDVAPTNPACRHIHYLGAQSVTLGCGPTTYCPNQTVTRDAMASFIAKSIVAPGGGNAVPLAYTDPNGLAYSCSPGAPNLHFTDVPASHPFCRHIHYLWARGIVAGCGPTLFCPSAPVRRDEMAKFIANAFALQLYEP